MGDLAACEPDIAIAVSEKRGNILKRLLRNIVVTAMQVLDIRTQTPRRPR